MVVRARVLLPLAAPLQHETVLLGHFKKRCSDLRNGVNKTVPPRTQIQESRLHEPANAPVEGVPLKFVTAETHEFEQLIVRDELRLENLAEEWNILTCADRYGPFWISHGYAATSRR